MMRKTRDQRPGTGVHQTTDYGPRDHGTRSSVPRMGADLASDVRCQTSVVKDQPQVVHPRAPV